MSGPDAARAQQAPEASAPAAAPAPAPATAAPAPAATASATTASATTASATSAPASPASLLAPPRPLRGPSLGVRLAVLIGAVNLGVLAVLVSMGMRLDERTLVNEVIRGAALFSDTIRRSTYTHMLEDRRQDAYAAMRLIAQEPGVEKVRIFNKEGRITFSTDQSETNRLVDKQAESCYACHASGQPLVRLSVPSRARIYAATSNGHRVLGMVTPIYNEEACATSKCHMHPTEQRVLGVVDIGLSLEAIDRDLGALARNKFTIVGAGVLLLVGLVLFFSRRYVAAPARALLKGTYRVAAGDLDHPIAVRSDDELGRLAASFNDMTGELSRARAELKALASGLERQVEERTEALRQAQGALVQSEKMSSLGKLAASIAHEINNPLAGILTITKLLLRNLATAPTEKDLASMPRQLKLIERETERCAAIVRNLLAFARQRPLSSAEIDANAPLDEALSLAAHQMKMQNVRLERHSGGPLPVQADFGQLRQACLNLVINAVEAMPQGGALVCATRAREDGRVEIEVADTGPGIPPELLGKVLDPFFTTKEKGTGLGLSVVYGIVERHGGRLELDSAPGRGTRAFIRLPRRRPEAAEGAPADGTPPFRGGGAPA